MYGFVPYNISEIQKGIQFGHAVVEYGQNVKNVISPMTSNAISTYNDWADNWKTFIILNGGTSNHSMNRYSNEEYIGSMEQNLKTLSENDIDLATFYEPDLNDMLSAIVFIVDERVFNKKDYPDFEDWIIENYGDLLKEDPSLIKNSENPRDKKVYKKWIDLVGGEKNVFLRDFLKNFRLA